MATITYTLSTTGQRASLAAGGDGKAQQTVAVERDGPLFARLLPRATIAPGGAVSLTVGSWLKTFDAPQTAQSVLDALDALDAAKKAEEDRRAAARRSETLAALAERRTTRHVDQVGIDRAGQHVGRPGAGIGVVSAEHCYETPQWPYQSDDAVRSSPEAAAWTAELEAARAASLEAALALAREKLPAFLAAEEAAAEKKAKAAADLAARKVAMGGAADDYLCRVEDGAIANVPCWQTHSRGKNWLALISVDPASPGGLSRDFAAKARGDAYYLLPTLAVGDAVEFGADYYSGSGRKSAERWYGFVVALADDAVLLRQCGSGKDACKAGTKYVGAKVARDK